MWEVQTYQRMAVRQSLIAAMWVALVLCPSFRIWRRLDALIFRTVCAACLSPCLGHRAHQHPIGIDSLHQLSEVEEVYWLHQKRIGPELVGASHVPDLVGCGQDHHSQ